MTHIQFIIASQTQSLVVSTALWLSYLGQIDSPVWRGSSMALNTMYM